MADLTVNLLTLAPGCGEALLLAHHIGDGERLVPALLPRLILALLAGLVPALLLGHGAAHLPGLVPALLARLIPALAVGVADLLGDGGALLLHNGRADLLHGCAALAPHCAEADLFESGAALAPRLRAGGRHLHCLAVRGRLVPALLLPDRLTDGAEDLEPRGGGPGRHEEAKQCGDLQEKRSQRKFSFKVKISISEIFF